MTSIEAVRAFTEASIGALVSCERTDLAGNVQVALGRLTRPSTVVCVVGEFKQGKSSLVNELLGRFVCPVDDDLSTSAITLIHYADDAEVVVRRRVDGELMTEQILPRELGDWVSEKGNPENRRNVERVEIGLPNQFLERGPAVVDTPGVGGLWAGHAAATLAFLPFADALIFVSDASAELSALELDFLRRAGDACPFVILCLTKIDLYPEWRRIADLNLAHLADASLPVPVIPVSSALRGLAIERVDQALNEESGYTELLRTLESGVIKTAKEHAAGRALRESRQALEQVASSLKTEAEVLTDPARIGAALAELEQTKARLEHLRGPGARWNVLLGDRITDLSNNTAHSFRTGIRALLRDADARFEEAKSDDEWKELALAMQDELAATVVSLFDQLESAAGDIRDEIVLLLNEEDLGIPVTTGAISRFDVRSMASDRESDEIGGTQVADDSRVGKVGSGVDKSLSLVRGAYGAVSVFGILSRVLPAAAASVLLSNPFTIGAGVVFGVKQVRDQKKKKVVAQRQQARLAFRAFVDEVQITLNKEFSDVIREVQRQLRDEFSDRITELLRTHIDTAQRCEVDAKRDQAFRENRVGVVSTALDTLADLMGEANRLERQL